MFCMKELHYGPYEKMMQFAGKRMMYYREEVASYIMYCLVLTKHSRRGGTAGPGMKPICRRLLLEIDHGILLKCHTSIDVHLYQRQASERNGAKWRTWAWHSSSTLDAEPKEGRCSRIGPKGSLIST